MTIVMIIKDDFEMTIVHRNYAYMTSAKRGDTMNLIIIIIIIIIILKIIIIIIIIKIVVKIILIII